jgi:hypothetical protein
MSHKSRSPQAVFRSVLVAGLLVLTSPGYATTIGDDVSCSDAVAVDLNGSLRGYGDRPGEPLIVELAVPSPGILSVDVAVPGTAAAAKLGFAGCAPKVGPEPAVLERSTTHLVLAAEDPGTYFFRLAAEDPRQPLADFKLRTGFSPDADDSFAKDEDDEELEYEPNPLLYEGPEESRSLAARIHELCSSGEVDDHGDSFPCATLTSPGRQAAGEIGNGWGDDGDVFLFVVAGPEPRTVEIETAGGVDTFGVLYDRSGQRLAASAGGGRGENFRLVRTLAPGAYFVRVEGRHGAEGLYSLRVAAATW